MSHKKGRQTIIFDNSPSVSGYAAVGSSFEKSGPLGDYFDYIYENPLAGQDSWEKAESELQKKAVELAIKKSNFKNDQMDVIFAGDLLNQCTSSTFGIMDYNIPFCGLYGACSTMALSLIMAGVFVDNKIAKNAVAVTSSHFCSAERQYRYPLEYGNQRPPTAQWTATASGCVILSENSGSSVRLKAATIGMVKDLGVTDANNMGAAMAPAAASTIETFFKDTGTSPDDYDAVFTGDLGQVGSELLYELTEKNGLNLKNKHNDCGLLLYDRETQDVHAGGSGCGCSASVLCTHIINNLISKKYKNILFCATGALLSPTTVLQGQSIPSIAHLVHFSSIAP